MLGDTCAGGRVGVAALGGVPRARRQTMDGVDKSSVAATSHTRAAAASTAMTRCNKHNLFVAIEHFSTADRLERRQALPRDEAARPRHRPAAYWRTPHAHCLELPVMLLSFACVHACLAQALYSSRMLLHASIRDTKLVHALQHFRLHRDHNAKKTSTRLPRNSTDIIPMP